MKSIEFESRIRNRFIEIPKEVDDDKFLDKDVKVILLFDDSEDTDFQKLATMQFLEGYDSADEIYDSI